MLASVLLGIGIVLVPGFVALWALGFGPRAALLAAPALSAAYVGAVGIAYNVLGIPSNLVRLMVPVLVLAAVVLAIRFVRWRSPNRERPAHEQAAPLHELEVPSDALPWGVIALYAVLGLGLGYYVFVQVIPFSNGMIESFDVVSHINRVRGFANSGNFSSFANPIYSQSDVSPFLETSSFYPAAFHAMAALVCMTMGIEPTGAINVMSYVFAGLVLPFSLALFLAVTLHDRRVVVCGSVVVAAFVMFPWTMLRWGPLFPNMAALAAMLAVASLLIMVTKRVSAGARARGIIAFLLGVLGLAFMQPNAVFAMGVTLAVYLLGRLLHTNKPIEVAGKKLNKIALAVAFVATCCIVWIGVVRSPFMRDVVSFKWEPFTYPAQAVVNLLSLGFVQGFGQGYPEYPQYALGALIVVGFVVAASRRHWRWLCLSYLLSAIAFVECTTSDSTLKHLMVGPWYNDPYRVAALVCLAAMPLAALGVSWVVGLVGNAIQKNRERLNEPSRLRASLVAAVVVFGVTLVVIFYPNLNDPWTMQPIQTAFGFQRQDFADTYNYGGAYSREESDFVQQVMDIVGDQGVIINVPADGSVVSYGFDGLHAYYREMNNYSIPGGETQESITIRQHLSEISTNTEVQDAVRKVGAHYVLRLSFTGEPSSISWGYAESDWNGIVSINDNTPGFETVLAEGELRLYRIAVV